MNKRKVIYQSKNLIVEAVSGVDIKPSVEIKNKDSVSFETLDINQTLTLCHALLSRAISANGYRPVTDDEELYDELGI